MTSAAATSGKALSAAPALLALALLLGGCAGTSRPPAPVVQIPSSSPAPYAGSRSAPSGVIGEALSLNGAPYRMGGETPATGFDCSGFVHYVYLTQGIELPRRAAAMARALPRVPLRDMRPGDLVFFNTTGHPHSHVGLYLGDGRFIHAPSRRTGHVRISDLHRAYWRRRLDGVRRPRSPHSLARRD